MALIRLRGFAGEARASHPTLLPEQIGTISRNQKPGRGDLRPWKQPQTVATVPSGRQTIYRMGRDVASDAQYWLSWTGVVHAVRGYDTSDTTERTYYTGDGAPKVTDNLSLDGVDPQDNPGANWRLLGVPAPSAAPSVSTVAGGSSSELQTVFYVYTYVSSWGWESAPSPVSAANTRKIDDTATIGSFSAPPSGSYGIDKIRIYRTETGSSGATEFLFLREIAAGTASTTDDNRTLGEVLPTTTWAMPPASMTNLTALWNGMLAGISGRAVKFCEPYTPYAWPTRYDLVPPDSTPVALGVFGQSLLVLTTGRPMLVQGSTPEAMDQVPLEIPQGCVAARSAVSMGTGVAWASSDGLCWYGAGGPRILTAGLMTREDWQALVPSSIVGRMYEGLYFGSYDDGSGRKGFMINPADQNAGIYFLDAGYSAMHFDELQDQLYVLDGTSVRRWDAGASALTARFRSKQFKAPQPVTFATAEVQSETYPVTMRVDAMNLPASTVSALVARNPTYFSAPDATTFRCTISVPDESAVRLPGGFMASDWRIELESSGAVQAAAIASSVEELRQS
jgi:hypothetical protein